MSRDHFIPEFLLDPWKAENLPLWHYNFQEHAFSEKPSITTIFAKRNLWSPQLEKFLNKHSENFSASARRKILEMNEPDWKEYRSLVLLVLFQAARTGHARALGTDLEQITTFDENKLDQLVMASQEQWKLCGLRLPEAIRLFFPDNGFFVFPVQWRTEFLWVHALPFSGSFCLALVPKEIAGDDLNQRIQYPQLASWSVASSKYCERVVIHPDLYHFKEKPDELARELERLRTFVDDTIGQINHLNALNREADDKIRQFFGIKI